MGGIPYQNIQEYANQESYQWSGHIKSGVNEDYPVENRPTAISSRYATDDLARDAYKYCAASDQALNVGNQLTKSELPTNDEGWRSEATQPSTEFKDPNKLPPRRSSYYSNQTSNESAVGNSGSDSHGFDSSQTDHRLTSAFSIQSASLSSVYTPMIISKMPSESLSPPSATNYQTNLYPYNTNRELIDTSRAQTTANDPRYNTGPPMNHERQSSFPSKEGSHLNANASAPITPGGMDRSQQTLPNSYQLVNGVELSSNFMACSTVADYDCSAPVGQASNNARTYFLNIEGSQQTTETGREGVFCYDKRASKSTTTMSVSMAFEQNHSSSSPIKYPSSLRSDIYSYGNCTDGNMNGNNWLTIGSDGTVLTSQAKQPRFNLHEYSQEYTQADNSVHSNFHPQKQEQTIQLEDASDKYEDHTSMSTYKSTSNLHTGEIDFDQPRRLEPEGSFVNHHLVQQRTMDQTGAQFPVSY